MFFKQNFLFFLQPPEQRIILARSICRLLLVLTAILAISIVVQAVLMVFRYRDVFPFGDTIIVDYRYFVGSASAFWILQDNGHLPIFVMPLFWIDLVFFKAQGTFLVACTLLLSLGLAMTPLPAVWRATRPDLLLAIACTAALFAMMFWLGNYANLIWPKQVHMYLSLFAVFQALTIASACRVPSPRQVGVMIVWLVVATFSFGYGMIGFPVVVALGLARRWPWRLAALMTGVFLACIVLYLCLSQGHAGVGFVFQIGVISGTIRKDLLYALTFIASPPLHILRNYVPDGPAFILAWSLALGGLAVFARQVWLCWRRPPTDFVGLALAFALFTVLTAVQTAFARSVFGYEHAADQRYMIGQIPFWAGLLMLAVDYAATAPGPRRLAASVATIMTVTVLMVSQQSELPRMHDDAQLRWAGAIAALNNAPDGAVWLNLFPFDPFMIPALVDQLRAHRWSVFAWPQAEWIGSTVAARGPLQVGCMGVLDTVRLMINGRAQRVEGWGVGAGSPSRPAWVVLADRSGIIRGLAHTGLDRLDVAATMHRPDYQHAGWIGYVPPSLAPQDITAYLIQDKHVCRLGGAGPAT